MTRRILLFLIGCWSVTTWAQTPIGTWRTHHAYSRLNSLAVDKQTVYAAGKQALLRYHPDDEQPRTISRADGLSEAGIATIAYDSVSRTLMIAYNSANIDLVRNGEVYNLSDIRRADIDGDKTVHRIRFHNGRAWLCCGFGTVVVDLSRQEVAGTYYLGGAVYDVAFTATEVVAATTKGLMRIAIDDPYPNIASRWQCDSTLNPLGETPLMLAAFDNSLFCVNQTFQPDSLRLYRYDADNSRHLVDYGNIQSMQVTPAWLTVCKWSSVDLYHSATSTATTLNGGDYWTGMANHDAITYDGHTLWVAHDYYGLLAIDIATPGVVASIIPNAPLNNDNVYRLSADKHHLLVAPGGKRTTFENLYLPAQVCSLEDERWQHLNGSALDTLRDIVEAVTDPTDAAHIVAASWGYGIVDIRNRQVSAVYNETNSNGMLQPYVSGTYRSLRTAAVAFDRYGNLWATNSLNRYGLVERSADGTWHRFDTYSMVGSNELDHVLCDSVRGYIWFYGKANMLYAHDGQSRMAYVDPNNGSKKTTTGVNCVVQDHHGDLWIGTNGGIKVIYDAYKVFANGGNGEKSPVTCSNIIIDNGSFVEYLMAYESITCIAVDGANRKWVGTLNGGLYLIADNGLRELQHFTTQNSPLLSNRILSIAIHPTSGEVFVGTDQGVISYRSTATYATAEPDEDIHAYPNPVEPDYDGPIAIKGFTRNALVHITDAAGHVVYSTRALGGQAIWYGRTNSGQRVASGVYYVFASDEEKGNRSVTKILVVR